MSERIAQHIFSVASSEVWTKQIIKLIIRVRLIPLNRLFRYLMLMCYRSLLIIYHKLRCILFSTWLCPPILTRVGYLDELRKFKLFTSEIARPLETSEKILNGKLFLIV